MANRGARSTVSCSIETGIATVTLSNPGRRNALSLRMFGELSETLGELEKSVDVRVVVFTGEGSAFCVGADLAAEPRLRSLQGDSVEGDTSRLRASTRVAEQLYEFPRPTIAAINGPCAGAGLSLAAAADFRIASDAAVFNTAFLSAGLSGDLCGIWFLTRMLGGARTRELFLTPSKLDAQSAYRLGLVNSIVSSDELDAAVRQLADRLAGSAPVALREMKQNLIAAQTMSLGDYAGTEVAAMVRSFHTEDAREAASAFLEKREPVFAGR